MKSIRHTGIVVGDMEKAIHFYVDLLGLKVTKRNDESGEYIGKILGLKNVKVTTVKMAADDGTLIELLYYHSHPHKPVEAREIYDTGLSHLAFTVADVETEYGRLSEAGTSFNSPPQTSPDGKAKVVFCRDPEGNWIELVEMLH